MVLCLIFYQSEFNIVDFYEILIFIFIFIIPYSKLLFFLISAITYFKEHDHTPHKLYALCSMSYLGAMLASNHALQHVTYPTQVSESMYYI